jgi:hypothetical protein
MPSLLDKYFPRPGGKAIAEKTIARALGEWAAKRMITTIVVFGTDVLFAVNQHGAQVPLPIIFNNFVWGMAMLEAVSQFYRLAKAARKRSRKNPDGIAIAFAGGVKPGDPGFEMPELPEITTDGFSE